MGPPAALVQRKRFISPSVTPNLRAASYLRLRFTAAFLPASSSASGGAAMAKPRPFLFDTLSLPFIGG